MTELLSIGILPVLLTLLAFRLGQILQAKTKSPICNPILVAVILVLLFLKGTGMELSSYQQGASMLSWLMTPATVSLAISMYEQFQVLRKNTPVILAGVAAGAVSCLVMVLLFCSLAGFDRALTVSLLPKSVTTAIGVPLSQMAGGLTPITTAAIILTGIIASVLGPSLCKLFRLTDEIARGAAFGTAGHVIGTAKATEMSKLTGAVSSLSLVVAGLLTAIVLPLVANLI
jgi:putative effector of murein hydrolase